MYGPDDRIEGVQWIMDDFYFPIKNRELSNYCSRTNIANSGYTVFFKVTPDVPDFLLAESRFETSFIEKCEALDRHKQIDILKE